RCNCMSRIIWARSGVIVAPLPVGMGRRSALSGRRDGATIRDAWSRPRTSARPDEPQPSSGGESLKEGEGIESDAGAGRGHKKTAAQRLSTTDDYIPFFTSDQLPVYKHTLLTAYGEWYQPKRQGARGAAPKRRRRPLPGLVYAQVVKKRAKGRVVAVSTHVVFGEPDAVVACLATSRGKQKIDT